MSEQWWAVVCGVLLAATWWWIIPTASPALGGQHRQHGGQHGQRGGSRATGPRPGRFRRAHRTPGSPAHDPPEAAVLLDLSAELLTTGVGVEAALRRLADTVPGAAPLGQVHHAVAAGAEWERAVSQLPENSALAEFCQHLSFAYATGAPSAAMLRAAAAQARTERRHYAEKKAEELGVKLMFPLGACFLPAFVLMGVLPVIISMLPPDVLP